jgi:hypothetical protein
MTPGQDHDVTAFPALMQEVDCNPEQLLGDKGYDSDAVRQGEPENTVHRRQGHLRTAQPHRAVLQSLEKFTTRRSPLR